MWIWVCGSAKFCACFSFRSTQPRKGALTRMDQGQGYLLGHGIRLWSFGVIRLWVQGLNLQWSHFNLSLPRKLILPDTGLVPAGQTSSRPYKETLAFLPFLLAHVLSLSLACHQMTGWRGDFFVGWESEATSPLSGINHNANVGCGTPASD